MGVALDVPGTTQGLSRTRAALDYAERVHARQRRAADGAPFIAHPREVASLLYEAGAPDHVIAAGALHDVLEKTPATAFDLRRRFGTDVATLVLAVSEPERSGGYARRKAALRERVARGGEEALMVFAADKIAKARELRYDAPPLALRARRERRLRLSHYRRSLALLHERLPRSPLVAQLQAALDQIPGGSFVMHRQPAPESGTARRAEQSRR